MRLNPHLHAVFLDGAYRSDALAPTWKSLGHLQTSQVGEVLEKVVRTPSGIAKRVARSSCLPVVVFSAQTTRNSKARRFRGSLRPQARSGGIR